VGVVRPAEQTGEARAVLVVLGANVTQTSEISCDSRNAVQWDAVENTRGAMSVPEQRMSGPGLSSS
jgi:hypothetical protein